MFSRPFLLGVLFGLLIWGMLFWAGAVFAGVAGLKDKTVVYTVKPGDCLWGIAERAGAAGSDYVALVALNPNMFGTGYRSWDLIFPGEKIRIPRGWAEALGVKIVPPEVAAPITEATVVPRIDRESPWSAVVAIIALFCGLGVILVIQPWNFFRPVGGGPPVVAGGVDAAGAAMILGLPGPTGLLEVKVSGLMNVQYANRKVKTRLAVDTPAWAARLSDGSVPQFVLKGCGNKATFQGNRFTRNYFEVVRELGPEPEAEEPVFEGSGGPHIMEESRSGNGMFYPTHPCVVGWTAYMNRLEGAVRGGGLRRD